MVDPLGVGPWDLSLSRDLRLGPGVGDAVDARPAMRASTLKMELGTHLELVRGDARRVPGRCSTASWGVVSRWA